MHLWLQLQPQVFLSMTYLRALCPILLCRTSGWMWSICAQPFSDLSCNIQCGSILGSGWATQRRSQRCPKATPLISWLWVQSYCPVGRWTFVPVWDPDRGFTWDLKSCFYLFIWWLTLLLCGQLLWKQLENQKDDITACKYELQGLRMMNCPFIIITLCLAFSGCHTDDTDPLQPRSAFRYTERRFVFVTN